MRRLIPYWLRITSGLLLTCIPSLCLALNSSEKTLIQSLKIEPDLEGDILRLNCDRPFAFITYTLSEPPRLVIDPVGEELRANFKESGQLSGQIVQGWNLRRPPGDPVGIDFIEIKLAQPAEHLVENTNGKLVLRIRPKEQTLLPPTGAETLSPVPEPPPSSSNPQVWGLKESLAFGLARHRPIRISYEEAELAQMKVREARRALYPVATLKYSWTEGVASEVNFTEYTAGLQLEQPIYYSGRLTQAYRQSLVNFQVAEKRQAKVRAEYSQELAQEYYQYVGAKLNRAAQEGLLADAEEFSRAGQARFDKGLLTRLEVLNIEAQVNQAKFQRANADNDVQLARLKYIQKLGLESHIQGVDVPGEFEEASRKPIDLEESLQLALKNKPDILVNSLLVKFQEYEERIAIAKTKFKVDLSGFIGQSAAAFETEPLDSGDDYFVGFKASRNWGPNSTNFSVTKTKTSPRLGQTTRTDSTVYSSELGILDQLQSLSEIQQARINLDKARRDLEEARNAAVQEVREAHISYEKARLQLDYAKQKIAFREEQAKILKAQASVNEALPSQVLEAVMRLAEERSGYGQALTNYFTAVAKLNKAVGLSNYYK